MTVMCFKWYLYIWHTNTGIYIPVYIIIYNKTILFFPLLLVTYTHRCYNTKKKRRDKSIKFTACPSPHPCNALIVFYIWRWDFRTVVGLARNATGAWPRRNAAMIFCSYWKKYLKVNIWFVQICITEAIWSTVFDLKPHQSNNKFN